ncbi:MAG: hypothetical protein M1404_02075 [Acidobacteria bacterium]|nr:hypothetical protein [Acidobacteriota bacterium]
MRSKIFQVLGSLLAFALISPVGLLFSIETPRPVALTSPTANLADRQEASAIFNRIQVLALKVRNQVGPLQFQGGHLAWRTQAFILTRIKDHVNKMSKDLWKLSQMRENLDPQQQQLLRRITPDVHELVYQTQAVIQRLNRRHYQRYTMAAMSKANYSVIYHNANQLVG